MTPLSALDIQRATNMFGSVQGDVRRRLEAVIASPNDETWNDAYSIILNGRTNTTLWQAVCAVDPLFPRTGPVSSSSGRVRWSAVPTQKTLLAAMRHAVDPPKVTCDMDPGRPDGAGSYHHGEHEQTSSCLNPAERNEP